MLQGKAKGNSMITNIRKTLYTPGNLTLQKWKGSSHNPWFLYSSMIDHYAKRRHIV